MMVARTSVPARPTCADELQSGDESGVDCGGSCGACRAALSQDRDDWGGLCGSYACSERCMAGGVEAECNAGVEVVRSYVDRPLAPCMQRGVTYTKLSDGSGGYGACAVTAMGRSEGTTAPGYQMTAAQEVMEAEARQQVFSTLCFALPCGCLPRDMGHDCTRV